MTADSFNLQRFVDAQQGTYELALAEIKRGDKRRHWMWFIFPQLAGLGESVMSRRFAIKSIEEARAYLAHPILGERLRLAVEALQGVSETTATAIFGHIDALKLRSSLTLFAEASGETIFLIAHERWFAGVADERTVALLRSAPKR
jgi:uncharacterized protein (DUF1810 family)